MTNTKELAQDVLAAALDQSYTHAERKAWMPAEYLALESDDQNLVDSEIDWLLNHD